MRKFATFEERLSTWTTETMQSVFELDATDAKLGVAPTNNEKFGDYQCNAAMELSKVLKMAPRKIAQDFLDKAVLPGFVEKIEIAGPGFINFFLSNVALAEYIQQQENNPRLGVDQVGKVVPCMVMEAMEVLVVMVNMKSMIHCLPLAPPLLPLAQHLHPPVQHRHRPKKMFFSVVFQSTLSCSMLLLQLYSAMHHSLGQLLADRDW